MKKITTTGLVAFALIFGFGCDSGTRTEDSVEQAEEATEERLERTETTRNDDIDRMDQAEFLIDAASGGMMEVEMGRMAANQAQHAEVKKFAQMMVTDHTKTNNELKTLAASKNVTLPERMGNDHQKHMDKMADYRGTEFDREYMDLMVEDHEDDVKKFRKASQNDDYDAEVRAFASKTLTTLEQHLQRARQVNDMVKGDRTRTTNTTTTETRTR
jgi:putative membrane protein